MDWGWLHGRFGDSIKERRVFKAKFREALKKIHDVYPAANVETTRDGIILHPSPTSVPPKAERRALDEGRGDWQ